MNVWIHFNLSLIKLNVHYRPYILYLYHIFFIIKIYFELSFKYIKYTKMFCFGLVCWFLKWVFIIYLKCNDAINFVKTINRNWQCASISAILMTVASKGFNWKIQLSRWLKDKIGKSYIITPFSQQKNVF